MSAGISSDAAAPAGRMWYFSEMPSEIVFARSSECRPLQGSAPYRALIAGEVRRGICVPVPGPTSRTTPEAVLRRGEINAEEPTGSGAS